MTPPDEDSAHVEIRGRIALLEDRQVRYDVDFKELRREFRELRTQINDLNSAAKAMRWIVSIALPLGPIFGVIISHFLKHQT